MKKATLVLLGSMIMFFGISCATFARMDQSIANEPFTYIYEFPGMTEDDIFKNSRLWVAETYNSAESVMTFDDAETGIVKGTGIGEVTADLGFRRQFQYNLSIETREGRARLQFSNIRPHAYYSGGTKVAGVDTTFVYGYNAIKEYFDELAPTYSESLLSEPEDW